MSGAFFLRGGGGGVMTKNYVSGKSFRPLVIMVIKTVQLELGNILKVDEDLLCSWTT